MAQVNCKGNDTPMNDLPRQMGWCTPCGSELDLLTTDLLTIVLAVVNYNAYLIILYHPRVFVLHGG